MIHSWHDYNTSGVEPFVWSEVRLDDVATARAEAERLAPEIEKRPHAALFLKGAGGDLFRNRSGAGMYQHVKDGGYAEPTRSAMVEFWRVLAEAEAKPGRLVLDNERGLTIWHLTGDADPRNKDNRKPFFESSRAWLHRLDATEADIRPSQYGPGEYWGEYQRWAFQRRADLINLAIIEPMWEAFGDWGIPASNYGDGEHGNLLDRNASPFHSAEAGNDASPVLYVRAGRALDATAAELQTHQLIDLNHGCSPWVAAPSYAQDTEADWTRRMRRLIACGHDVLLWGEVGEKPDQWNKRGLELLAEVVAEVQ